jgi:dTDP-4-dehydrorhamnose 3,5-epimerase
MGYSELKISGCYLISQKVFPDERGLFREWFRSSEIAEFDSSFTIQQANFSHSKRGVIRGMHFSVAPEGQSKIVTCTSGAVTDVLVDLRIGSPSFLEVVTLNFSEDQGLGVFIASGVGHGFQVSSTTGSMMYLTSSIYAPTKEKGISPLDPELRIEWPISKPSEIILSGADTNAPTLRDAEKLRILPSFQTN